jgi:hypothetical protein
MCGQSEDPKQEKEDVEQAGHCSTCTAALEEECGALRAARDALQIQVKELETKVLISQEQANLYFEEQLYELTTESYALRAEVQDLQDAHFSDTSEILEELGKQIIALKDQPFSELLIIERKFIETDSELSQMKDDTFYEEITVKVKSTIDDRIEELSNQINRLIFDVYYVDDENITEARILWKNIIEHIAGYEKQVLSDIKDVEHKFSGLNNELLQVKQQFTTHKQREDVAISELEERIIALTSGVAAKRQPDPRRWKFLSSRGKVSVIYPTLFV